MAGKEGVLKLMHTTDQNRKMTFELKSWYQRIERRDSKMENTSAYLKGLFSQALEGCDEADKTLLLGDLDTYLESRKNQFGSKSLVAFVDKLEALKNRPEIIRRTPPAARTYGKALLTQAEAVPWKYGSMKKKSTLGKGGQGKAYLVKVPLSESHSTARVDRVVKVGKKIFYSPVTPDANDGRDAIQVMMRSDDFAASRLKNEKNIIRPEEYYIAVKESREATTMTSWRVPAHELKGFVRNVAQRNKNAQIGIYATVMPLAKGKTLVDGGGSQSITGVTRQVAHGVYQAMTDLHKRGFAHNDLKLGNILYDEKTGGVTLIDTGLMHKDSKSRLEFKQSTQHRGTPGYKSPQVAKRELHGSETDYYSFACLLLTTTEPEFVPVLSRIYATEYVDLEHVGEGKGERVEILKNQPPASYPWIMIEEGKRDSKTRDAALRLEEKMNNYPNFRSAIVDSFIVSAGREPAASQARQRLATNPYLKSPEVLSEKKDRHEWRQAKAV